MCPIITGIHVTLCMCSSVCLFDAVTHHVPPLVFFLVVVIMGQIQSQLVKADAELKPMVKGVPQNAAECHTSLMKIVSDYCRLLRQARLCW